MFLGIYIAPQQTAAWRAPSARKLLLCVSSLWRAASSWPGSNTTLSVMWFACNCNSKASAGLSDSETTTWWWDNLALFGARLVSAYSRPFHCVPLHQTEMSWSHLHAFLSLCVPPPFVPLPISSDCIPSLCLSLILSVGWLNISAWLEVEAFFGRGNILIICMKSLVSSSALGICGTDSSREVNECHCISEEELFHAITLKVQERTDWKEWRRERKRAWERIITTLRQVYPIVFENLSLWQVPFVKGVDR